MAKCTKCGQDIYGDSIYPIGEKAYCEECAAQTLQQSGSFSGFGCAGPFISSVESKSPDE